METVLIGPTQHHFPIVIVLFLIQECILLNSLFIIEDPTERLLCEVYPRHAGSRVPFYNCFLVFGHDWLFPPLGLALLVKVCLSCYIPFILLNAWCIVGIQFCQQHSGNANSKLCGGDKIVGFWSTMPTESCSNSVALGNSLSWFSLASPSLSTERR